MAVDPTDTELYPVGTTNLEVLKRNAQDLDKIINSDNDTIENRVGDSINSMKALNDVFNEAESSADAAAASASEAESSADNAELSASASASSASIIGAWEDATGAGVAFTSYTYQSNSVWMLVAAVADITATEPSSGNSDWAIVSRQYQAVPYADLHIPFNDGLRIESGNGNHDQLDVSATQDGSIMVDQTTMSVDFTRSGVANGIDKSGTIISLAENESNITKNGIFTHDGYTNYTLNSNSLYNFTGNGTTLSLYSDDSPFNTDCTELVESSATGVHFFNITPQFLTAGDDLLISFYVKAGVNAGDRNVRIGFASSNVLTNIFSVTSDGVFTSSSPSIGSVESIGDGWYRISVLLEGAEEGNTVCRFEMMDGLNNSYEGDGSSSFFVSGAMLTKTKTLMPLVITSASSETVSATSVSLPTYANLPFRGNPFSIVIECDFPDNDEETYTAFSISSDAASAVILLRKIAGVVRWYHDDSDGTDRTVSTTNTEYTSGMNKYILIFDAENSEFSMYVNGDFIGGNVRTDYCWFDNSGTISFPSTLNSTIKSFKVYHEKLTAAQVSAIGY